MKENKKGISLIVLVITIIVMIILASAVIISLTGNSVIDRAGDAVDVTNLANVQQLASTLWAEAYMDGVREKSEFTERVKTGLTKQGIKTSEYTIVATTSGVTVSRGWLKDGYTVVKGEQVINIGDKVEYDETVGGTKTGIGNPEWQVLGADKDGNLLLVSSGYVKENFVLGDSSNLTKSQNDWLNAVSLLNAVCEPYGYGKGVVGKARSLTVEDIDNITGYDKTTYGKGTVEQYGNEVTYSYNGTTKPAYTSKVKSGVLNEEYRNGFYYYDGEGFTLVNDLTTKSTGTITTLNNTSYAYDAGEYVDNEDVLRMLFMWYNGADCWLASASVSATSYSVNYGVFYIEYSLWDDLEAGDVTSCWVTDAKLCTSQGTTSSRERNVKAVVTLSSELVLTEESEGIWIY